MDHRAVRGVSSVMGAELSRRRLLGGAAVFGLSALTLTACSSTSGSSSGDTRKVSSAYGTVELPVAPKRVVATDNPSMVTSFDVGLTPLGNPDGSYLKSNLPPKYWADIKDMKSIGGDKLDPDKVASLNPDVIIGLTNYISKSQFATLQKIAPVYVLPTTPMSWQQTAAHFADALNRADRLTALKKAYDARCAKLATRYARVFSGNVWESIYTWDAGWGREAPVGKGIDGAQNDLATLRALGATLTSDTVTPGSAGTDWQNESFEQLSVLQDADVILSLGNSPQMTALPAWKDLKAVKNGHVYVSDYLIANGYSIAEAFLDDVEKICAKLQAS
jgi:ABC-type Fe3+-hydroxamate transport system substrate-binding protein